MTLGDRAAVLRAGHLEQVAPPMELYRRPGTRFVAGFIGSPSMNLYRCRVTDGDGPRLRATGFRLDPGDAAPTSPEGEVELGIRPHDVELLTRDDGREADATGRVELVEPRGSDRLLRVRLGEDDGSPTPADREDGRTLVVIVDPEAHVREGDRVAVRLPRRHLHFFDPRDGRRLE